MNLMRMFVVGCFEFVVLPRSARSEIDRRQKERTAWL